MADNKVTSPPALNIGVLEQRYRDRFEIGEQDQLVQMASAGGSLVFGRMVDGAHVGPWMRFFPDGSYEQGSVDPHTSEWKPFPGTHVKAKLYAKVPKAS